MSHNPYEIDFIWHRPLSSRDEPPDVAADDTLISFGGAFTQAYHPLEDGAMYRKLAETHKDPAQMARFAAGHGPLLSRLWEGKPLREATIEWRDRCSQLWEVISLWNASQRSDAANARLDEVVDTLLGTRLQPRLRFRQGVARLMVSPANLWEAAVLQFVNSAVAGTRYRRCANCAAWLAYKRSMRSESRTACSPACRQKLYRERMEQARILYGSNCTIEEIADKTETNIATVQQWVKAAD